MNRVKTVGEPKSAEFEKDLINFCQEGMVSASRAAIVMSQYSAYKGLPYRFSSQDVLDLHECGVLSGGVQITPRRFHVPLDLVVEWIAIPSSIPIAVEFLDRKSELRAIEEHERKIAEQFALDVREEQERSYRQMVQKHAEGICANINPGAQFERDLSTAIGEVIKKHYLQIPSTVARLISNEVETKMNIRDASIKYGHRFTAAMLDRLTESWLKRLLSNEKGSANLAVVNKALRWVGSTKEGRSNVYVVKPSGTRTVKIGIAENLESRIGGIQTGSPFPIKCLLAFPGGRRAEEALHEAFSDTRLSGEWFVLDSTMKEFVLQGRSKLHKLLALTESPRFGKKVKTHLALIQKHAGEDDWLTQFYGLSAFDAGRMADKVNKLIDYPENIPDAHDEQAA